MLASSSPATLQSYLVLPPLSSPSLPLLPPPLPLHSGCPSILFFDMPPLKYRGLLARCFLPSPRSDMLQSLRTGSEVTPLNPSNHLCCRTCSHYSPGLLSGLREGRPPSVHQYCQNRGRCLPSGSSSNVNGLPYWGVVLNTPQEDPHDSAAIPEALPQGEKLDRHPRPPATEEPPRPRRPRPKPLAKS